MPSIKYRRGQQHSVDMAVYMRKIASEEGGEERSRLLHNLVRCIREDVSPRQREVLLMYYVKGQNQREIALELGVDKSTISRTIKRGEERLRTCLRYGAERYLRGMEGGDEAWN